jgi:uncharacterized membrane protein
METEAEGSPSIDKRQRFVEEVQLRRLAQVAGLIVVVVFALLALVARIAGGTLLGLPFAFWGSVAALVLIAKLIFLFFMWRCPACGSQLGPNYSPRFCSSCGFEFRPHEKS